MCKPIACHAHEQKDITDLQGMPLNDAQLTPGFVIRAMQDVGSFISYQVSGHLPLAGCGTIRRQDQGQILGDQHLSVSLCFMQACELDMDVLNTPAQHSSSCNIPSVVRQDLPSETIEE